MRKRNRSRTRPRGAGGRGRGGAEVAGGGVVAQAVPVDVLSAVLAEGPLEGRAAGCAGGLKELGGCRLREALSAAEATPAGCAEVEAPAAAAGCLEGFGFTAADVTDHGGAGVSGGVWERGGAWMPAQHLLQWRW